MTHNCYDTYLTIEIFLHPVDRDLPYPYGYELGIIKHEICTKPYYKRFISTKLRLSYVNSAEEREKGTVHMSLFANLTFV